MARNSKKDFFTLAAIVLFFGTVYSIIKYGSTLFELRTPSGPARQVIAGDNGWVEKWRKPLLLAYGVSGAIANGTLFIPVQTTSGVRLSALNVTNGLSRWEQESDAKGERLDSFDSIAADNEKVYATSSFALSAFDAADGRPLWTTLEFYAHATSEVLPPEEAARVQVQVFRASDGNTIYDFDSQSGLAKSVKESPLVLKLRTDTVTYYLSKDYYLMSIDNQSGRTLWSVKTRGVPGRPVLTDSDILVIRSGYSLTKIMGLDPASGQTLWQTEEEDFVSNLIVVDDTIYALTTEPAIVGYDVLTGREKERLTFGGGQLDTKHSPNFWLLSDGSRMFVYFSDSQELIAFERQ